MEAGASFSHKGFMVTIIVNEADLSEIYISGQDTIKLKSTNIMYMRNYAIKEINDRVYNNKY